MAHDVHSLLVRSFALPSACLGIYFASGVIGVLTALSLRRTPAPAELHVMSPTLVLWFGAINVLIGALAICAAIGLVLVRSWGVRLWKGTSISLALVAAANLIPYRMFAVQNLAFVAILVLLAATSHITMGRSGAAASS